MSQGGHYVRLSDLTGRMQQVPFERPKGPSSGQWSAWAQFWTRSNGTICPACNAPMTFFTSEYMPVGCRVVTLDTLRTESDLTLDGSHVDVDICEYRMLPRVIRLRVCGQCQYDHALLQGRKVIPEADRLIKAQVQHKAFLDVTHSVMGTEA